MCQCANMPIKRMYSLIMCQCANALMPMCQSTGKMRAQLIGTLANYLNFFIFLSAGVASIMLIAKPPLRASLVEIFVLLVTNPFFIW